MLTCHSIVGRKSIRQREVIERKIGTERTEMNDITVEVGEATVAANIPEGIQEPDGLTNPTEYNRQPARQWDITNVTMVSAAQKPLETRQIIKSFTILENADMDISPDSTPTSEPSYSSPTANNQHVNSSDVNSNSLNHEDSVVTSPNGHVKHSSINSNNQLHHQMSNASSTSISSANRLLSNSNKHSTIASSSPSTHNYVSYHSSHHHRHRSVSPNELNSSAHHNNVGHETNNMHHNSNSLRNSPSYGGTNNSVTSGLVHSASRVDLSNSNHLIGDGPPTPEMDLNSAGDHRRSKMDCFPAILFNRLCFSVDGTSGVSSLQSVMAASQTSNRLNLLTPSLAKFFRADLITHVTNWPSEVFEKQVSSLFESLNPTDDWINHFRHKNAPRMFICTAIWSAVGFPLRFNVQEAAYEWKRSTQQFKDKGEFYEDCASST